jgi:lipoate---protein ligase
VTTAEPGWRVEHLRGSAAALHAREIPEHPVPTVWFLDAAAPAVVLGSAEPENHIDRDRTAAAGLELVRRRSGGGAVLVEPESCTWVDLIIPAGHPLWRPDVGVAMHWIGDLWSAALADLGVASTVNRAGMRPTEWSPMVCFAGLGPGEVVDGAGRKLVGVSQRRTRRAARFQSLAYHAAPAGDLVEVLALDDTRRAALREALAATTGVLDVEPGALAASLVAHLPLG